MMTPARLVVLISGNGSNLQAILDACHKRARPIIMTTIAMTAGMLPVAMALGAGDGSFRSPMAVSVIGGLHTSTLLSLLVIPVAFTLVDDVQQFLAKLIPSSKRSNIKQA